jgi:CheY-like chemotaxis protein
MSVQSTRPDPPRSPRYSDEPDGPIKLLIVDDGMVDRRLAGAIVERVLGWKVLYADNGRAALEVLKAETPRIILTDLNMPEMDGLQLVAAVRKGWPLVPVVLMTAFGNENIALSALRAGAASYVPKMSLAQDLASTLEQVVIASQSAMRQRRLLKSLGKAELHFRLENDRSLIPPLVAHLQQYLDYLGLCDYTARTRVGVAMEEALLNAMFHGNLEVSSDLRQQGEEPYFRLAEERRTQAPYRDRQVNCVATLSPAEVICSIEDEGQGYDPTKLPDPTDPANLERIGGRGLLLIRTFMDEVEFSSGGKQITMTKKRELTAAAK